MALFVENNLPATFLRRVGETPHRSAYLRKKLGSWLASTWQEVFERVSEIALALQLEGIQAGDRVALLSQTRPEWLCVDLAVLSLGAVTVPIYSAVSADDTFYILKDSGSKAIFVEDSVQRSKVRSVAGQVPDLRLVVAFEKDSSNEGLSLDLWVEDKLRSLSAEQKQSALSEWKSGIHKISKEALATIAYTSGSSGLPRGVELSHQNFLETLPELARAVDITERDVSLSFLPAAHIMGRIEQYTSFVAGLTLAYAENFATLVDNLSEVKPSLLVGVPRIFEKLYGAVLHKFQDESALIRRPFNWALSMAQKKVEAEDSHQKLSLKNRLEFELADRVFFQTVREKLGGRLRFAISGGAPLAPEIAKFFFGCGLPLYEGYGLTESTGPVTLNRPGMCKIGTVGYPLPGCEIQLAPDGEIMVRGKTVFRCYHNEPSEKNAESKTQEGWFYTGDLGQMEPGGPLRVTGRKKDLIVTSGGRNIAPQKIENLLKTDSLFSQALIVGDRRPYLGALLTIHADELRRVAEEIGLRVEILGIPATLESAAFVARVQERINKINSKLASFERIKRFRILPREFTIEAGELTPSLKMRRPFCTSRFAEDIEKLYRD